MAGHLAFVPQHGAEAARVAQAHQLAVGQHEVEVVVFLGRGGVREDAQAAAHAQVQDERAVVELDEQVFRAALQAMDGLAAQEFGQVFGNGPAQAGVADDDVADGLMQQVRRDAAQRGLDFWQFGHMFLSFRRRPESR